MILTCNFSFKDGLTIFISSVALIISILSYISSYKLNKKQFVELTNKQLPNLKILSILYTKKLPSNQHISDGSYCRIYTGESSCNISLDNNIATYDISDISVEDGFIDEIKSHMNRETYLTYFNSKPYLIANHATDKNRFIIDHSNVKITFHNYGAKISALSIESLKIFYKPEMNIETITLSGSLESKITFSPEDNELFEIFFDEVTTDFNNSMCQLPTTCYLNLPESFDLLKSHMPNNILCYEKLEIVLICWDMYNKPVKFLVTIEYNGNFFISSTTLLKS